MLRFAPTPTAVVRCFGDPDTLDRFPALASAVACRVASNELILLGKQDAAGELLKQALSYLDRADPEGLVAEHTDGWSAWTLWGDAVVPALACLSLIQLPAKRPAFVQGAVSRLPAKVLLLADRALLLIPSTLAHHMAERIRTACADLGPEEIAPGEFSLGERVALNTRHTRSREEGSS